MHLALVEDNPQILSSLSRRFEAEAYSCYPITDFQSLSSALSDQHFPVPQFLVLDRLLGDDDSVQLLPRIKQVWPDTMVIVLSAIGTAKERAQILELGADDYLNKPYDFDELLARIKALCRRGRSDARPTIMQIQNTVVSEESKDLEVSGQKVGLTRQEFLVASVLMRQPNKVFSKIKLLDSLWHSSPDVESNVVEATVSHLRKKLERAGSAVKIQSKRNIGYWVET